MLLVLPWFVLIFTSCGGDDEGPDTIFIVGTWNGIEFAITECFDPNNDETINCDDSCIDATFTSDGAYTITNIEGTLNKTETGTYIISGNILTICENGGPDCATFMWDVSSNQLTLSGSILECNVIITFERA